MSNISKENLIPLIEKYYESFINEKDEWTFFLELTEYIELIQENEITNKIVKDLLKQKENDLKILNDLESDVMLELEKSRDEIRKRVKEAKITSLGIETALKELQALEEGRLHSSLPKARKLNNAIQGLVVALHEEKREDLALDFFDGNQKTSYYPLDDYVFSKSYREYMALREAMEFKEKTTLWFVWEHLTTAYLAIRKADEILKGAEKKDEEEYWKLVNFAGLVGEMRKIQGKKELSNRHEVVNPIWFMRDEFIQYAKRFHKHLIKTLISVDPNNQKLVEASPSFDRSTGILWIDGKPIKFGTKTNPYQCLKAIFSDKNLKRDWFFNEIAEEIDEAEPKPDKLIHNYFNNTIKPKIATETGIKDFFITTNQSVKINEKYLSEKS